MESKEKKWATTMKYQRPDRILTLFHSDQFFCALRQNICLIYMLL